jgi:hypothetical protein
MCSQVIADMTHVITFNKARIIKTSSLALREGAEFQGVKWLNVNFFHNMNEMYPFETGLSSLDIFGM